MVAVKLPSASNSPAPIASPGLGETRRRGIWISGTALLLILTLASSQTISAIQFVCACALLCVSIKAYLSWAADRETKIPVWAMVCGAHFIYFGLPIFGALRASPSWYDHGANLPDLSLTYAMLVGVLGLASLGLGRKAALHLGYASNVKVRLMDTGTYTPLQIQVLLVLGSAVNVFGVPFQGTSFRNISITILNIVPLAAFLWITLAATCRKLGQIDFLLAAAFLVTRLFSGARFGASLSIIATPLLLMGLAAVSVNRRLPWRMIGIVAGLIIFLQPSKLVLREQIASGDLEVNQANVLLRWIQMAAAGWKDVFSGDASLESQLTPTASRSSLLTMAGLIVDKTPAVVPYQHGANYPLLLKNLIPRFLWPEKPIVNVANQFFQVEYGLTAKEDLSGVSIACGFEAEGYMNFGWFGIIAVGLFVGFVFAYYEFAFFSTTSSSLAATAVGLALLPGFLAIESQLVQYLGGVVQIIVVAFIIFREPGRKPNSSMESLNRRKPELAVPEKNSVSY